MTTRLRTAGMLLAMALLVSGCAASKAFRQAEAAAKKGDLDGAVTLYRKAAQADEDNADYQIALQRAMQSAARAHMDRAREFENQDQLEAARSEYRLVTEYEPSNRLAEAKVIEIDRIIRDRVEAMRPRPFLDLQERARASSPVPLLNPASREPITMSYTNTAVRDILNAIGAAVGINVTYDRDAETAGNQGVLRQTSVQLDGVTIDQALNQVLSQNQLSYKVVSPRAILVFQDTPQKHAILDDQVIQTFPVSHANPTELTALLSTLVRPTGIGVQPVLSPNPANNSIIAKASVQMMQIIERLIQMNDKPPAEVVIDVEILEVNRTRTKQYGLNLTEYAVGIVPSPEVNPVGTNQVGGAGAAVAAAAGVPPSLLASPPPFNLNTISRGVSTSDFYLAVPAAVVRFLESDNQTKLIAKPQLRGTEGTKLTLRLGEKVPLPSTTFTPIATGGASTNPLTTFTYTDVGVNLDLTPRVTVDNDIVLDLIVENSSLGASIVVNGVSSPTIGTRTVTSRLRLRDGESNLLAGLLKEEERKLLSGFPGAIHLPILKQLFSGNENEIKQTDIVMLLTPHVVRTKGYAVQDLQPIYLGSGTNWSLGGPPPLVNVPGVPGDLAGAPGATPPGGGIAGAPAVGAPVPGTVATPPSLLPAATPPTTTAPPAAAPTPAAPLAPAPLAPPPTPANPPAGTLPPAAAPGPPAGAAPPAGATGPPGAAQPAGGAAPPEPAPATSPGLGSALIMLTPPATPFRVGGGPYNVPVTVSNATRLSTVSITVNFDPTRLRVRSVQEGSFMRSGGVSATFAQQIGPGRVDITITRPNDATGASGTGLLGSILFDAVGPGPAPLSLSGVASGPGGAAMGLQLRPVTITVQQ